MSLLARKPFTIFFWSTVLLIIIVAEPEIMFFVIILGYAISGPIWWLVKYFGKTKEKNSNIQVR
jgi:CDP-diacylglycerol---serine O-phosphatidyltransferase